MTIVLKKENKIENLYAYEGGAYKVHNSHTYNERERERKRRN